VVGRVFGIDAIARVYDKIQKTSQSKAIADRLLEFLEISYTTSQTDQAQIPASGAAIVTVNHPFGILDGAILASLLTKIRPDVRFLANGILSVLPELVRW
jgi:putative hemolysin